MGPHRHLDQVTLRARLAATITGLGARRAALVRRLTGGPTSDARDAERILQRMWLLGHQVTQELDPARVLERFLEAVVDVAQADAGALGMLGADSQLEIVHTIGARGRITGLTGPVVSAAMTQVVRSRKAWRADDVRTIAVIGSVWPWRCKVAPAAGAAWSGVPGVCARCRCTTASMIRRPPNGPRACAWIRSTPLLSAAGSSSPSAGSSGGKNNRPVAR